LYRYLIAWYGKIIHHNGAVQFDRYNVARMPKALIPTQCSSDAPFGFDAQERATKVEGQEHELVQTILVEE
jgi:hypothetical protein